MSINKKINYVVFDTYGNIKKYCIGNLVATSDKIDEIYIAADFDVSNEETAYRCYARVKRADGFILGPFTLILDQLTADEAEEIGVEYLACRKLVMTKDMLEVDGRVMITIVFDQVNTEGKVVSTKATGMVVANIYDAVPEILTEEEYNDIKTEMLPRDLGDLTVTDTVLDTDVIIVNTDGVSKKITLEDLMKNFGLDSYASVAEQVNTNKDNIELLGGALVTHKTSADHDGHNDTRYLGLYEKAVDSDKLDGYYSSDFVQKAELFDSSMKIKSSYFAEYLKTGMKPIGVITTSGDKTTADLLEEIQSEIGEDISLQRGCYFIVHYDGPHVAIEISQGHNIMVADDGRIGQDSGGLVLETNDLLVYVGISGVKHQWMVINNTYPTADASTYGVVMLATEQEALAGTNQSKAMTPKDVKLAIEAGAEVNVQSDWAQEVDTADDYIKNKPTIPTKTSELENDSGYQTESQVDDKISTLTESTDSTTEFETIDIYPADGWAWGTDGYSSYVGVNPDTVYDLFFDTAPYEGTGICQIDIYQYDADYVEILGKSLVPALFQRLGTPYNAAPDLFTPLFPNGGLCSITTSENCKYVRLCFSVYALNPERLPTGWKFTYQKPVKIYTIKQDKLPPIPSSKLDTKIVSNNLINKDTVTTEETVFLGYSSNGTKLEGWYLTTAGTTGVSVSGSGINSTTKPIEVIGGEVYNWTKGMTVNMFDELDRHIDIILTTDETTAVMPVNAKYVRLGFIYNMLSIIQFVKGTEILSLDDYKIGMDNFSIEEYPSINEVLYRNALKGDYMHKYLNDISNEANLYTAPDRLTFMLITDSHFTPQTSYIASIVANLTKYVPCSFIAHTGDIIDGIRSKASELKTLLGVARNFNDAMCPTFYTKGNHDDNSLYIKLGGGTDIAENYITNSELYCRTNKFNQNKLVFGSASNMYYYYDDPISKVRSVFVNMFNVPETVDIDGKRIYTAQNSRCFGQEQLEWLANVALNFSDKEDDKSNWGVIVFSHIVISNAFFKIINAFASGTSYSEVVSDGINSSDISVDYTPQGAMEFIAYFIGDYHYDSMSTGASSYNDFPIISTLNSSRARDNTDQPTPANGILMPPHKAFATENDTAFDIVSIDRTNHLIYLTRYGARSYAYNSATGEFDQIVNRTRIINYETCEYTQLI